MKLYFDYNSTTPICQEAKSKMNELLNESSFHNSSSVHSYGRKAKLMLEEARIDLLKSFNASKYDLAFVASGTEANNLILDNFKEDSIFISQIEHLSIYRHIEYKNNIKTIRVNREGILDLDHLDNLLKTACSSNNLENNSNNNSRRFLVSVMMANNETGVIQPMKEILDIVRRYGAFLHSDCAQVIGKINLDFDDMDLDFASISGHKFGGPTGSGALLYKKEHKLTPLIIGGGQEKGLRSGTENLFSIVGMAAAAASIKSNYLDHASNIGKLRDLIEEKIKSICPDVKIPSRDVSRLANTSVLIMPAVNNQLQLVRMDLNNISVSSGSACSSGKTYGSHVLKAMNYNEEEIYNAIRISLGPLNKVKDVEIFCKVWENIYTHQK